MALSIPELLRCIIQLRHHFDFIVSAFGHVPPLQGLRRVLVSLLLCLWGVFLVKFGRVNLYSQGAVGGDVCGPSELMFVTWLSVTRGRSVGCVVVSRVLSPSYKQCWMEGEKGAEMGFVCSCNHSLMVLRKSLLLAKKWHCACQKKIKLLC